MTRCEIMQNVSFEITPRVHDAAHDLVQGPRALELEPVVHLEAVQYQSGVVHEAVGVPSRRLARGARGLEDYRPLLHAHHSLFLLPEVVAGTGNLLRRRPRLQPALLYLDLRQPRLQQVEQNDVLVIERAEELQLPGPDRLIHDLLRGLHLHVVPVPAESDRVVRADLCGDLLEQLGHVVLELVH